MSLFPFYVAPFNFFNWWFLPSLISLAALVVQIAFGIGIYRDGLALQAGRRGPAFAPPWAWGVATGLLGFPTVVLYWLLHYSKFTRLNTSPAVEQNEL